MSTVGGDCTCWNCHHIIFLGELRTNLALFIPFFLLLCMFSFFALSCCCSSYWFSYWFKHICIIICFRLRIKQRKIINYKLSKLQQRWLDANSDSCRTRKRRMVVIDHLSLYGQESEFVPIHFCLVYASIFWKVDGQR